MLNFPDYFQKFQKMREIGQYVTLCFDELNDRIVPGISTGFIGEYVRNFVLRHGINNSQYGYKGFPGHCCTSVNEVLCHGIPSDQILNEGDIVSVDLTFNKDTYHGDACRTYCVGDVDDRQKQLVEVAYEAKQVGLRAAMPGALLGSIGQAIYDYVDPLGYCIASDFVGHGICHDIHEAPQVAHCPSHDSFANMIIRPGMTFTIEPIIMAGKKNYRVDRDRWTVFSKDGLPSAQFESTLGINETGNEEFCF